MNWLADKIEQWPTAKLLPYARNARTHSDDQVAQIAASIAEFGFTNPILAGSDGIIVAGHGRLAAAQKLGLEIVPVVVLDHLSPTQRRALVIADNRIAENAGWDESVLAQEVAWLQDHQFNTDLLGFNADFLDGLLAEEATADAGLTDEDSVPDVRPDPVSKLGDVWLLGKHRVMCGDSTSIDAVDRLLVGQAPNTMVTDPPYGVKLDQSWRDKALGSKALGKGNAGLVENDDRADWYDAWVLFPGDVAYVWHASSYTDVVMDSLRRAGFDVKQQIIWNKSVMVMGRSDYHFKHEPCWYAIRKGKTHNWLGDRKQTTIWDAAPPNHIMGGSTEEKTSHPTQKPAALYERAILNHTNSGEYVYEPFGGSGTSVVVCEKLGRRSLTMELDPKYVDVIVRRWQSFTGKRAVLESTGQPFPDEAPAIAA